MQHETDQFRSDCVLSRLAILRFGENRRYHISAVEARSFIHAITCCQKKKSLIWEILFPLENPNPENSTKRSHWFWADLSELYGRCFVHIVLVLTLSVLFGRNGFRWGLLRALGPAIGWGKEIRFRFRVLFKCEMKCEIALLPDKMRNKTN